MKLSTTARHCELTSEVREFAERRIARFERLAHGILEAHLVVTAEKYRHTAEITLRLDHHELVSREQSNDAHAAIDRAAERIEEQLRRHKERRLEQRREGRNGEGFVEERAPEATAEGESPSPGES
jgi:putative sigma-54 modulation protein